MASVSREAVPLPMAMCLTPYLRMRTDRERNGFLLFPLAESGIDHGGGQHLAGGVHHGDLAAVAVSGVKTHGDEALDGGLHQQRLQIQGKIVDSALRTPGRTGRCAPPAAMEGKISRS